VHWITLQAAAKWGRASAGAAGYRSGGIHVNCALIHAPIGLIRAAARSVLSHIGPQADPIENPGQTWLF
jgi:hypothetical protein